MDERTKGRRTAILWFVAAALALTAAIIRWSSGEGVKWALFAATIFMTILGWITLQKSRSMGG